MPLAAFTDVDEQTELAWTDDQPLDATHVDPRLAGPGLIVLLNGGAGLSERVVWAESSPDVVGRLVDMLLAHVDEPVLAWWLARGGLRYRVAPGDESPQRRRVLSRLTAEARLGGGIY
ncbi:MAG TPA: hypothetical protein VFO85_07115 [Vicinamibacteria bacterium]|nr:hypothetical protein [Vicinamibacteria bacterium]